MLSIVRHPLRFIWRLGSFTGFILSLSFNYLRLRAQGPVSTERRQAWMKSSALRLANILKLRIRRLGDIPESGIIASNHLSYLDIVVIATVAPGIFVSKSDVRYWPVIGALSAWAGTLYVSRNRRADVARVSLEMATALKANHRVIVFPEGTSSDGQSVLDFHSSLFSPAEATQCPVTPCCLRYREPGNDPEHRVCYWGSMLFLTHFLILLTLEYIEVALKFGQPITEPTPRKQLAKSIYAKVSQLAADP
ncbi:MAG: 1-acyl-sn-glycerol-3-phosphate acyltransferase [Verrucomicrobia subdivision 3 bacterium]|nr:1-acyl-sn-glycerol-3-phosphate acyltransferase [Limisphaerales bacterium]MCS1416415.1 1-acyl-sn-glycerol-3-phosphate acyltransferase [Limisphaerales bacterium]